MREFKFRYWDIRHKNFTYSDEYSSMEGFWAHQENSHCKTMQFTGLLDKNGKEIYEGDLLSHKYYNAPVQVTFKGGSFIAEDVSIHDNSIEIVGNIYENPELISKNSGAESVQHNVLNGAKNG